MKILLPFVLALCLTSPARSADFVITKGKHTDRANVRGQEQPAKHSVEVAWIGADRMRVEEGEKVAIVRLDLKKLYMLDTKAKTVSALDLPVDVVKLLPEQARPMLSEMFSMTTVTVTATEETRKIENWDTIKHRLTMTLPMGGSMEQDMWVSKDIGGKREGWQELYGALLSINPIRARMVDGMKKVDGVPVLVERTQKLMGTEIQSRETVVSVEEKDAPEGFYDPPKDYESKPFDPMQDIQIGPGGRGPRGG